jgi:hypothetical protein
MENSDLDLIEAYLGGKMPPDEKHRFKDRLNSERELATELRAEKVMREALKQRQDEQMLAQFKAQSKHLFGQDPERTATKPKPELSLLSGKLRWATGIAASLALILVAYFFIPTGKQLGHSSYANSKHFKPSTNSGELSVGDLSKEDSSLRDALKAYKAGDYASAARLASTLTASEGWSDQAHLLLGTISLEQGNNAKAILELNKVRRSALSLYNKAQWNIAWAHINAKDSQNATQQLEKIKADLDNNYASDAAKLLADKNLLK